MKWFRGALWALCLCVDVFSIHAAAQPSAPVRVSSEQVRILLASDAPVLTLRCEQTLNLTVGAATQSLPAGTYMLRVSSASVPRMRYHLFVKTFQMNESAARDAWIAERRAEGLTPEIVTLGRRISAAGVELDTRVDWISLATEPTASAAESRRKQLVERKYSPWIQAQTVAPGRGTVQVIAANGSTALTLDAPLTVRSTGAIGLAEVQSSYSGGAPRPLAFAGGIEIRVGASGRLDAIERLPIEDYLRGVLPAEMSPSWPAEALKAQAVAARSDVAAGLGGRYALEGFDFFATERSRAYLGATGWSLATDAAVRATVGEVLRQNNRIVPAVFSANCGGWSENNDSVWAGPADAALRGAPDMRGGSNVKSTPAHIDKWLHGRVDAWCAVDDTYFRWQRAYTEPELRAIINRGAAVGRIEEIDLGARGVSGRLVSVRVRGSRGSAEFTRELAIRQAFGGLPSAMFTVSKSSSRSVTRYTFTGGGRGHGVGLCQQGARGMALGGHKYSDILRHYYSGVALVRCD